MQQTGAHPRHGRRGRGVCVGGGGGNERDGGEAPAALPMTTGLPTRRGQRQEG